MGGQGSRWRAGRRGRTSIGDRMGLRTLFRANGGADHRAGDLIGRGQRIVTLLVKSRAGSAPTRCFTPKTGWASILATSSGTTTKRCTIIFRCSSGPEIKRPHPGDLELVSFHEDPEGQGEPLA